MAAAVKTYPKFKGFATTDGQMFEVKTSALLFLRGLNSNRPFQLASNVDGAGAFDDILLKYLPLSSNDQAIWNTYFLQLKHKVRAKVTTQALTASKGDFSLVKYFESFLTIKETMSPNNKEQIFAGPFENCYFIIYTNAIVSDEMKKRKIIDSSSDVDDVVKIGSDTEFIFGFNEETDSDVVSCLEGKDDDQIFFKRLKIFSGEPRVEDMDALLKEEILKAHNFSKSEVDRICNLFVQEFEEWCRESNEILDQDSNILNKAISKHKLEVIEPRQKEEFSLDIKFKKYFIEEIKVALIENASLLQICPGGSSIEVCCNKVLQTLEDVVNPYIFIGRDSFLCEKDAVLSVWKSTKKHLLVIVAQTRQGAKANEDELKLSLVNDMCEVLIKDSIKRLVFLSFPDDWFVMALKEKLGDQSKEFQDDFYLNQLEDASLEKVLNKTVFFQGQKVEKKNLIGEDIKELTIEIIDFLLSPSADTKIGDDLADDDECYIDRTLQRHNYIKKDIWNSQLHSGKCAITGISEDGLHCLTSAEVLEDNCIVDQIAEVTRNNNQFIILDSVDAENDFIKLCETKNPVHWLHMEDDKLIWKRSSGRIFDLLVYVDEEHCTSYNPHTSFDVADRVILLVAEPGMGKTTFLTHLAQQTKINDPSIWVICINLNDCSEKLETIRTKDFSADEILKYSASTSCSSAIEKSLFRYYLDHKRSVVILVDGFDEIAPKFIEEGKLLLSRLLETNARKVWVTSRHSMKDELESHLSTVAFSLKGFSSDDQANYLLKFWSNVATPKSDAEQREFILDLIKLSDYWMCDKERQFTGIPLQTKMLAELFQDHFANQSDMKLPEKLDLLDLYEKFINMKYKIAAEDKYKLQNITNPSNEIWFKTIRKDLNKKHTCAALKLLLDQDSIENLQVKKIDKRFAEFMNDVRKGVEKTGIVDRVINEKPHFIHRTFAEFFVGIWLADNCRTSTGFLERNLYEDEFQVIRCVFERKLSRGSALHMAVLNVDASLIKSLLKSGIEVNSRDQGGRTALHLATAIRLNNISDSKVNLNVINILLEHGADVALKDTELMQWTPLRYADENKAYDVIDLFIKNEMGNTDDLEIITQRLFESNLIEMLEYDLTNLLSFLLNKMLVKAKLIDENTSSLIYKDTSEQHVSSLLNSKLVSTVHRNENYLHSIMLLGSRVVTTALVRYNDFHNPNDRNGREQFVNSRMRHGTTALHLAAHYGHVSVLEYLVSEGGNVELKNDAGLTPLHYASHKGYLNVVQFLLRVIHDKDQRMIYVNASSADRNTALHYATNGGHTTVVQLLLAEGGEMDACGDHSRTPLHCAIGHVDVVELLVSAGCNIIARDNNNSTVLTLAAERGKLLEVKLILESLGDDGKLKFEFLNQQDSDGDSAVICAAHFGHAKIVQLLVNAGADMTLRDNEGKTALQRATLNAHQSVIEILASSLGGNHDLGASS